MDNKEKTIILIVDDNPTNLQILFDYLEKAGFKILVAPNGERAVRQLEKIVPDIILLDIMMPGIDGYETCRRIKENEAMKDIPVIFMSALSDTFDKIRGFEAGAVDYVTKPFQQEEVLARINAHLTIRRQKKQLSELNSKLYESNITKDKFFSVIAHDLKNAFFPLFSYPDLLTRAIDKEDYGNVRKYAGNIKEHIENAYKLMENLLNWSRVQIGTMDFRPQEVHLYKVGLRCVALLAESANQKEISLSYTIDRDIRVYADPDMTDTILRNLISNAVKFTDNRGRVTVSARSFNGEVEISVSDTGIGISKENLPKLFRIDQVFKKEGTAGERGTGLGLILCREFVEKNKGKILVESELGKGTTFRFTLPGNLSRQ